MTQGSVHSVVVRLGIIGFPGSGKTTLFNLLTGAEAGVDQPPGRGRLNVGVVRVPDDRVTRLSALFQPKKTVYATVDVVDLAGFDRGERATLDVGDLRQADALLHVVRAFRDPSVAHPQSTIDPVRDARTIEDELILADLGVVERRLERLEKDLKKTPSSDLKHEHEILLRCRAALDDAQPLRRLGLQGADAHRLRGFQFLSAKPLLLVVNLDEADVALAEDVTKLPGLSEALGASGTAAVGVCAKIELEIAQLDPADAQAFLADLGLKQSGLDRTIRAAYDLLGYISFFTVGEDECRAWSIPANTPAQEAAGAIHSDIQRGFIRAEVVAGERLLARGSLAACRDHGELRLEGKEYVVLDGDVINFRHAT